MSDPRDVPLVPLPRTLEWGAGAFLPGPGCTLVAPEALHAQAARFAEEWAAALGTRLQVAPAGAGVEWSLHPGRLDLGDEGYELYVDAGGVAVVAATAHGVWNATRTLLQLTTPAGVAAVHVVDIPRFEWRGAMLDVARHPFTVAEVCRFVELIAGVKLNRLHLHLTDDQGWRFAVPEWPALTEVGGASACLGDPGGWFTVGDWAHLVEFAEQHFVTVVPEIDLPGHTHAALASVPALNPDGVSPEPYLGKEVGHSTLRLDLPATRPFLVDVIAEVAARTPGPYLHIGGDEAHSTSREEYVAFIEFLQAEVHRHGKRMVGWEEITAASLHVDTVVQHWLRPEVAAIAPEGCRFVLSPSRHTYLDMLHREGDPLGRRWAGAIDVDSAYGWDPAAMIPGVGDERIAGVEAPLWTEKVRTFDAVQTLTFPRLACLAEVGWTPQPARSWDGFRPRLRAFTDRLAADGVPVYRSTLLDDA